MGEASLESKVFMESGAHCKLKLWYYLYTDRESDSWPVLEIYKHSRAPGDDKPDLLTSVSQLSMTDWQELVVALNKSREFVIFIKARTSKDASVSSLNAKKLPFVMDLHCITITSMFIFFSQWLQLMISYLRTALGKVKSPLAQAMSFCARTKLLVIRGASMCGRSVITNMTAMMGQTRWTVPQQQLV
jgi:hypothetical protein